ncbi:MAG: histidine phosphatase family protein [Gammaproteobacteria bacterium]|nr:histidine phosphatase family protein [Gammaproteobacteria bacterium]
MHIYLVRHGEAAASWQESEDPGLSALGLEQAQRCADQLAASLGSDIQLVSSPRLRAWETALPLGETLSVPVIVEEAFREIEAPVPLAERQKWLHEIATQRWEQQHESVQAWRRQVLYALRSIYQPTVVFCHFMVINAIVGELTQAEKIVCCMPDNTSVTVVRRQRNELELIELGDELKTVVN